MVLSAHGGDSRGKRSGSDLPAESVPGIPWELRPVIGHPFPGTAAAPGTEPASGGGKGSVPAGGDLFITNRNIPAK